MPLPAVALSAVDDGMEQDASPVNGSTSDGRTKLLEQLEHLGRLKDAGVLGADEFEDAKAKLINDFQAWFQWTCMMSSCPMAGVVLVEVNQPPRSHNVFTPGSSGRTASRNSCRPPLLS